LEKIRGKIKKSERKGKRLLSRFQDTEIVINREFSACAAVMQGHTAPVVRDAAAKMGTLHYSCHPPTLSYIIK
jgi:hypothetical protein